MIPPVRSLLVSLGLMLPVFALAQTDEIQVYDASITNPGATELTVHSNYTPDGRHAPEFAGGITPNHSVNGAFEFAYGCTDDWELGLYLPVYTITNQGDAEFDGAKLRSLFVSPQARTRELFYGVNFEYSYNLPHWAATRTALEVRPIVGWHVGAWDFILNPIFDSNFNGLGGVHFAPAERIAYNLSSRWTLALEEYGDLGPIDRIGALPKESQSLFAVVDYTLNQRNSLELGAGHGLTASSDRLVLKLIWNHEL
jgi:hypothetical protein